MSGIAGVFFRDARPARAEAVEAMLAAMKYRGPDGAGVWTEGNVALGCLMLRNTPESRHEKLTKVDRTSRFVLTADARIDNRIELMSRLGIDTHDGCVTDDADLLFKAREKWGDGAPAELQGDFAYCIRDRVKNKLLCSRDGFGVHPFYYYLSDKLFAFGSEIRPLLRLVDVPARLNETMVGDHLIGMQDDRVITFFEGILRLPPGHSMVVCPANVGIHRYWSLDPNREVRLNSDADYTEAFRELFLNAVSSRLRSSYPVATYLSGGLDSSSVTCAARDILRQAGDALLITLSVVYDQVRECDEQKCIDLVPRFLN